MEESKEAGDAESADRGGLYVLIDAIVHPPMLPR